MMKRCFELRIALVIFATVAAWAAADTASAQFQSCNFCDVRAFSPDPFDVNACDTGTIIINGQGFRSTGNNGCSTTPVDEVRSTRPDRILILGFTVLSDTRISMDYSVPCNASSGIAGIDVTIDDNPTDTIVPYACGNARMFVHARSLAVTYGPASARPMADGVEISWLTLSEETTLGFTVWMRLPDGTESAHPTLIEAHGALVPYSLRDSREDAVRAVAYRVVEVRSDGSEGDGTEWLAVERPQPAARGGRTRSQQRSR